jgi:hypothetical protein
MPVPISGHRELTLLYRVAETGTLVWKLTVLDIFTDGGTLAHKCRPCLLKAGTLLEPQTHHKINVRTVHWFKVRTKH